MRLPSCGPDVAELERRAAEMRAAASCRPNVDRAALLQLAHDLPAVWNAPTSDMRTKQRLTHILIHEVLVDLDETTHEAVLLIHWTGGRHSEIRIPRNKTRGFPPDRIPNAVAVVRKLAGHFPDREIATCLNRMRCKRSDGETWTTVQVLALRERLGLPAHDPSNCPDGMISLIKAAERLQICVGSARKLIDQGRLPANSERLTPDCGLHQKILATADQSNFMLTRICSQFTGSSGHDGPASRALWRDCLEPQHESIEY